MLRSALVFLASIALAAIATTPSVAHADAGACATANAVPARQGICDIAQSMDVELAASLTVADVDVLAQSCAQQLLVLATCTKAGGACDQQEAALGRCVADREDVVELYQRIAEAKKAAFGRDLYFEFAGVLAVVPLKVVERVGATCKETEVPAQLACMAKTEMAPVLAEYAKIIDNLFTEVAKSIQAAGNPPIEAAEFTPIVQQLLLRLPIRTILSLAAECEAQLAGPNRRPNESYTPKSKAELDAYLTCVETAGATNSVANPAFIDPARLKTYVGLARDKVVSLIRAKESANQSKSFHRILLVLALFAGLGSLVVLLLPLYLDRKYPGQRSLLWKSSGVAAATFALAIGLLGVSLLTIRSIQGAVAADSTSPKMRIAKAAFDILQRDDTIALFSDMSKARLDFLKKPLKAIGDGGGAEEATAFAAYLGAHWAELLEEPEVKAVLKGTGANFAMVKRHVSSFKSVLGFYKKIDWLMGLLPIVLSLLAVLLYVLPLKNTLRDIATVPIRAARGEIAADGSLQHSMKTIWKEIKSVLPFLGAILVVFPLTGIILAVAVEPLVELLLAQTLLTIFYLIQPNASAAVLYLSLLSAILLLVLALSVYILTTGFFLGTCRKIFRAIYHHGYRWSDFKSFWIKGSIATVWLLVLPLLYVIAVRTIANHVSLGGDSLGAKQMLLIPLTSFVAFPIVFWAARGMKALVFLKKYPVPQPGKPIAIASIPRQPWAA